MDYGYETETCAKCGDEFYCSPHPSDAYEGECVCPTCLANCDGDDDSDGNLEFLLF